MFKLPCQLHSGAPRRGEAPRWGSVSRVLAEGCAKPRVQSPSAIPASKVILGDLQVTKSVSEPQGSEPQLGLHEALFGQTEEDEEALTEQKQGELNRKR